MTVALTPRQKEVVKLVSDGLTYAEIGERLGIAAETVRVHVARAAGGRKNPLRWVIVHAPQLLNA